MEIVSLGPLPASSLIWQPRPGAWVLTVVARATFLLRPGEATLAPSQESPEADDRYAGDDPAHSLRRPRDLVPAKPLAEVMLVGSAFAPERRPTRALVAHLAVGEIDKRIEVIADRYATADGVVHEGSPFLQMPLTYERAAGGPPNPAGVHRGARDAEGRYRIPNLQRPGAAPSNIDPIGFGPISPSWPERRDRLSGAAESFSYADLGRRPLPEGMDLGFFNAAPRDQQLRALSANETIVLENLHPDHPRLTARLPGVTARASLEGRRSGAQALAMRADTLWIDTDRALATLTFRGMIPLESADEQGRVLITMVTMERASLESSGVIPVVPIAEAPSSGVARPPRKFEVTADIPLSMRQAPSAALPFTPAPPASPAPITAPPLTAPPIITPAPPVINLSPRLGLGSAPGALDLSNAAAGARRGEAEPVSGASAAAPRLESPLPAPEPRPAPRPEVKEALELVWFDLESVPRLRRKPAFRAILDRAEKTPHDPDFDDPALARDPMLIEDRREVFEILAHADPLPAGGLEGALASCQREDGKFVPSVALFTGELETPLDEISALRATVSTATPFAGSDEALRGAIDTAKELLALPDLLAAPAVAEALTRRVDQAFSQGKRAVPGDYLEAQRERALVEQRKYQRKSVFGDKHLRALLRFDAGEAPAKAPPAKGAQPPSVPVYLPEGAASLLPLQARFRVRFVAEVRLAADPAEGHPAALRVLALARAVPAMKR